MKDAGLKIGIGSASKNAHEVLRRSGIASFVDACADGYAVERSEPAPDVFIAAAEFLGVLPETCVVVEDAEASIEAAHAAGMQVGGVGPLDRAACADLPAESLIGFTLERILSSLHARPV
jgi:beta-phosphoglucomutase-like phosphatase (HAD superfamily)